MTNTPLLSALSTVSVNGVRTFPGSHQNLTADLLQQAHGIVAVLQSSFNDAADLRTAGKESEFDSLNELLPHQALDAVATLIGLARALSAEG
jgi:hypothetical protein